MDANTNPIELCGTVAAVIYQNEENGYTVLKLDVDDGSQTMVVGCIPYAVPGESMIVTGSWMTHPAHGQQFKAEFAERTMPETADTIYAYLAGRAVRGIGPATASLLVSRFGADTLNVLEYEPEKLTAIKGITLSKAKAMSANFRRQAGMRRLIEFLASANIRPVIALRMYQYYGDEALQLVQDNPYSFRTLSAPHFRRRMRWRSATALTTRARSVSPRRRCMNLLITPFAATASSRTATCWRQRRSSAACRTS